MERKRIGLALSGGGARGFSHVGVLKVFAEHNIRVDMIAGTSAGSIVGGALAAGMSAAEIEAMARKAGYLNMMRPSFSVRGLLSNTPMGRFLERELPVTRFEDLTVPFGAVVYDLKAGEEILMKDAGDLAFAIRASCRGSGRFCTGPGRERTLARRRRCGFAAAGRCRQVDGSRHCHCGRSACLRGHVFGSAAVGGRHNDSVGTGPDTLSVEKPAGARGHRHRAADRPSPSRSDPKMR